MNNKGMDGGGATDFDLSGNDGNYATTIILIFSDFFSLSLLLHLSPMCVRAFFFLFNSICIEWMEL